jgi:lipid A ethanolaminephosphotransferase
VKSPTSLPSSVPVHPEHALKTEATPLGHAPRGWRAIGTCWWSRPRSARFVVVVLSVYLLITANWPLWIELARIGGAPSLYMSSIVTMAVLAGFGTVAVLALTAWTRGMKPIWFAVVLIAAIAQYYMLTYRVVMDPTMMANTLQTDFHETRDLLGWRMVLSVTLVALPAAWWLLQVRILPMRAWGQIWRNVAMCVAALTVVVVCVLVTSRELAPLMRNHVTVRYLINPLASLYSTSRVVLKPMLAHTRKLIPTSAGAALGATYAATGVKPPLFVVVVGETARADHFALNGYGRETTPELAAREVASWRKVHSCGTNTLASVPCMFSPLGKEGYENAKDDHENLVDVAQAAGLAVLWIDNQPGGCKGVCERVPNATAISGLDAASKAALCSGDECLDDALLIGLERRIEALAPERRAKGVLLLLHQMGSHGPAYYKRSSADMKRFVPECKTNVLSSCSHGELVNAYDNSIAYTDRFLGRTIDWLKTQSTRYAAGMLYLSDHGESLGEFGIFLHGLPYQIAPEVQKHIPMVVWFDPILQARISLSTTCLKADRDTALTHDNLYHTVLGVMDITTPSYQRPLDAFAKCRTTDISQAGGR